VALPARRRLGLPVAESVDEVTQSEQVADSAEIVESLIGIRRPDRLRLVVGPTRRNQRAASVRQNCEQIVDATPCDGVDQRQCPPFEGMAFARDRRTSWNIMAMGSSWLLPSTRFRTIV
jgi:hypothetical protein